VSEAQARPVRTRFAPSPTGFLHIGGVRTALFSWLQARHHGGQFILRIEDTDRARSTEEAIQVILDGMEWLGLRADEGPLYQTDRFERYGKWRSSSWPGGTPTVATAARTSSTRCARPDGRGEKPRYDGRCRDRKEPREGVPPVLRFRNPDSGQVVVDDKVRGRVVFDNRELDDLVLLRSDGVPTYNFSVVVDDMDMGITHVVRGDDHLNNTPRQINLYRALGAEPPVFAHVPMILGPDGAKLSKRHGAVSVLQYRQDGLPARGAAELPGAARLVPRRPGDLLHRGDDPAVRHRRREQVRLELQPREAAVAEPALHQGNAGARLGAELGWQLERLGVSCASGPKLEDVAEAFRERARTLHEMAQSALFFYQDFEAYHDKAARQHLGESAVAPLTALREQLAALADWRAEPIHGVVDGVAGALGLKMGKVAQPLRVAVSGGPVSPPIDVTVALLGKDTTLARIDRALKMGSDTN
jgi:glutamyl-tRNA synthetase